MIDDNQVYIIVDIETDGPVPGIYSMLSIGAIASTSDREIGSFYRKLLPVKGAKRDHSTMGWWAINPEAWMEVNAEAQAPEKVIKDFCAWIKDMGLSPVFVASPLAFDYSFVSWYLERFAHEQLFSDYTGVQRTLDLASFTAGKIGIPLNRARRSQLPASLKKGMPPHSHKAIDDARGYGVLLRNILKVKSK